jgi:hypothetical protein
LHDPDGNDGNHFTGSKQRAVVEEYQLVHKRVSGQTHICERTP